MQPPQEARSAQQDVATEAAAAENIETIPKQPNHKQRYSSARLLGFQEKKRNQLYAACRLRSVLHFCLKRFRSQRVQDVWTEYMRALLRRKQAREKLRNAFWHEWAVALQPVHPNLAGRPGMPTHYCHRDEYIAERVQKLADAAGLAEQLWHWRFSRGTKRAAPQSPEKEHSDSDATSPSGAQPVPDPPRVTRSKAKKTRKLEFSTAGTRGLRSHGPT